MLTVPRLLGALGCVLFVSLLIYKHAPTKSTPLSTANAQSPLPSDLEGELLSNPGFEEAPDSMPLHWMRDLENTGKKGSVSRDAGSTHTGTASLRLQPSSNNGGAQPLAVTQTLARNGVAGRLLSYSGYVRVQGSATAHLGLLTLVGASAQHLVMLTQPQTGAWTALRGTYEVPTGADVKVVFICWVDGIDGAAWFDDMSLRADGEISPIADEASSSHSAQVDINAAEVIRHIPSTLFGANVEWIWNGNGLWLPSQDKADAKIVALSKGMGVKLLRYPGGVYSDFYHWKNGVGPARTRPEELHLPNKDERSRALFGTDEALRFAKEIDAELLITVNAGSGTAQEAADWVRYVNVPVRRVKFWEVGNELYLNDKDLGPHAVTLTPEQYASRLLEFSSAMRAVDPQIKILAIGGQNHGRFTTVAYPDWNKIVLSKVQKQIDYLSVHNAYAPLLTDDKQDVDTVYRGMLAAPGIIATNLESVRKQIETYAPTRSKEIGIAVTEWGPAFRFDFGTRYIDHGKTLGSALFSASAFQVLLSSKKTDIASFWQLNDYSVLGWIGTVNTSFPPKPEWVDTARARAFSMFTRYFGPKLIHCSVKSSTFASEPVGLTDAVPDAPDLTTVSSLAADGNHLYVISVNRSLHHDLRTTFSVSGFIPAPLAQLHTLNGSAIDANTGTGIVSVPGLHIAQQAIAGSAGRLQHGGPTEIWEIDTVVKGQASMVLSLPAHSISALVLTRASH